MQDQSGSSGLNFGFGKKSLVLSIDIKEKLIDQGMLV